MSRPPNIPRIIPFALAFFPLALRAASNLDDVINFSLEIVSMIVDILVGLAVLVFFWGIVKFMTHAADEKSHEEGRSLMIWGMVGIFVMVALWSVVGYIQQSVGLDTADPLPALPGIPDTIPGP